MFRSAFKHDRCLILADGFYEWQGNRGRKQPYRICRDDRAVFAFAGLWSQWKPPNGGDPRTSTTILTTTANEVVEPIHDRMPVILEPDEEEVWLHGDPDGAHDVLGPFPASALDAYPVSTRVNNPANDSPELFEEIDIGKQSGLGDFTG